MNIEQSFENYGLSEKEASIYIAALELGVASVTKIAAKARVQRPYFYDLSKKLLDLGLIKQIKVGKKKMFVAANPDTLLSIQKARTEQLRQMMPELKALHNTSGNKPNVYYFDDWSGIDQINQDTLTYKGEVVAFTTPRFFLAENKRLSKEHIKKRLAIKQTLRLLGEDAEPLRELKEIDWKELRHTKLLSKEQFQSNIELGVYGNKTFIVDYKAKFGLVIEGSEIARTIKQIFELIWNKQ